MKTIFKKNISYFTCPVESPKCHLYRYIFDNKVLQFYLDRPINYIYKPYICKMRISAHNLNIETGRFYNIKMIKKKIGKIKD
jgi:hypothetical protein